MMMKKMLALLLAAVMVLGMIPFGAMAEESAPTETTAPTVTETTVPETTEGETVPETTEGKTVGQMYIAQAEALLAQAEALDTDAEDLDAQCDAIYNEIWALVDEAQTAWEADEMTNTEMETLIAVANDVESVLEEKRTAVDEDSIETYAGSVTVEAGSSATCTNDYNNVSSISNHSVSPDTNGITLSVSDGRIVVSVDESVEAGTYTISGQYRRRGSNNNRSFTITVTVTSASGGTGDTEETGKIKVYVYVASQDSNGNSWRYNEEFQDLIGLYVCDSNGYFPAGAIELDASYLTGKNYNTSGAALINSEDDWDELLEALSVIDTSTLDGTYGVAYTSHADGVLDFEYNRGNSVNDYLSQASKDLNRSWGSQKSALFRWHKEVTPNSITAHLGFGDDTTTQYHLDLCFNTNKITFITGNNGIESGAAQDGTTVDTRVYITGSEIQEPRNLYIPEGYQFMGYYEDPDFTTPWDGIGTPLNEDEVVYIKITEKDNVIIYYVNVSGDEAGSLSSDSEGLNPNTGVAKGSTATANDGNTFAGWYSDAECQNLLSEDENFVPTKDADEEWINGTTYYAKFERSAGNLTINKTVEGMETVPAGTEFTFTVKNEANESQTVTLSADNNWTYTLEDLVIGEYTITETKTNIDQYDLVSVTANDEDVTNGAETTTAAYSVTVTANGTTVNFVNTYELAVGNLKIVKTVTKAYENDVLPDDTFEFTVDVFGTTAENYNYTVFNADDTQVSTGTLADGGKLNLKGGQYAQIDNVPVGAYTVTETANTDYTTTSEGATGSITKGATSTAAFTNEYKKHKFDLTIRKAGVETADQAAAFVFNVAGNGLSTNVVIYGNGSVTIKDLPNGTYTVTETSGYWRYELAAGTTAVINNADASVTITNKPDETKWLDGIAHVTNKFSINEKTAND